ncbi:MAG: phosphoribosylaminoimidazolesuccinocarboxamide synthase [Defluviitaleaceae bacterium]|nr:phosphoribosylaminoimidazolesuccinocarboxamide synthase [Defluviitaleaceae bacterium]MCL2261805.1 phosphoribosylaminoimidazolesuccinocarboxamide synthase [Defluviitaleaceae bacterium]
MKLIYQGKTKDVYDKGEGILTLKLKDDATGKDGVFDPGENTVGLSIDGLGRESLRLTAHYFELLTKAGVPNHYVSSDIEEATMDVRAATTFGKGLEFICRVYADGSFLRRYGEYINDNEYLNYFVETTLKDDARQDPPITKDALDILDIMPPHEYETCKFLSRKIAMLISDDLKKHGLELHDIKFEFAKCGNEILLIDEISAGCMRVYKDGKIVPPMDIGKLVL